MLPDMGKEIVRVKGAKQAAARFGVQAPYVPVVGIAIWAGPAHFYKRKSVGEQCLRALSGPVALLPHDAHVHTVKLSVRRNRAFSGTIAQQFIADKPFYGFDFVVIGALPRHPAFLAIVSQCPERNA